MFYQRYMCLARCALHRVGFPPSPMIRASYLHTKMPFGALELHPVKRIVSNVLLNPVRTMKQGLTPEIIQEKVLTVCSGFEKIPAEKLKLDAHFMKDMGLDSLDHIEVIMEIENEFCIFVLCTTHADMHELIIWFPTNNEINTWFWADLCYEGLEIPDLEAEKLHTPQDIVNHVCAMAARSLPIE